MTEVMLNASMHSNLLSLQQTQKLQDRTQLRLSTGLKVNSAIDNPSSYYTATSLNNRASDLSALLDTMSQGIQTIKAANEALETGTAILQQAKAVAEKVSESSVDVVAKVHNEAELLAAVEKGGAGYIVVENDIKLSKNTSIHLKDGQSLVGASYFNNSLPKTKISFDFDETCNNHGIYLANNSHLSDLEINGKRNVSQNPKDSSFVIAYDVNNVVVKNIDINGNVSGDTIMVGLVFHNSVAEIKGDLNINMSGNGPFRGMHVSKGSQVKTADNTKINIQVSDNGEAAITRGIVVAYKSIFDINNSEINIKNDNNTGGRGSYAMSIYNYDGELNINNSKLNLISSGDGFFTQISTAKTTIYNSEINAKTKEYAIVNYDNTVETSINGQSKLFFDADNIISSKGILEVSSDTQIAIKSGGNTVFYDMPDFSTNATVTITQSNFESKTGASVSTERWNEPDWDKIENEITTPTQTHQSQAPKINNIPDSTSYTETISQYDMLINDASYKGVNLLQSNDLKINFNEDRTSGVEVKGVDASSEGLGVRSFEWNTQMDILNSVEELEDAINQLRSFSAEFGNYYAIVTTREDFTENLINVLTEGADKLTLADMNAEAANMLALQTRQQLAINSLSLASQASQSVLKLF